MKDNPTKTDDEYTNAMFNIRANETEKTSTEIINLLIGTAFIIAIAMASEHFSEPSKSHHQQTVVPHVQR